MFPHVDQQNTSKFKPLDNPKVVTALSGEASTRTDYSNEPGLFEVDALVTSTKKAELEADYDANRRTAQDFEWQMVDGSPSDIYSVYWDRPPQFTREGNLWQSKIFLRKA